MGNVVLIPSEQGIVLYPMDWCQKTVPVSLNPFGTGNSFISIRPASYRIHT